MSWRRNLRPGSFRGAAFEAYRHVERGRIRGAHHEYPLRDKGWVEQLGRADDRISLSVVVRGDDYVQKRDALRAALKETGAGELIHPWLGSIRVVVDPGAPWTIEEDSTRGRQARFSLSFLISEDTGVFPDESIDGVAATAGAADEMLDGALPLFGARIDLSGAAVYLDDMNAAIGEAFAVFDEARTVVGEVISLQQSAVGVVFGAVLEAQEIALEALALRNAVGAIEGLFDAAVSVFGGRKRKSSSASLPGLRPAASRPDVRRKPTSAARSATAARLTLDGIGGAVIGVDRKSAANRAVVDAAVETVLIGELARAVVETEHDSHDAAIIAMKDLDQRIETAILREADRDAPDDGHIERLSTLRAASRNAVIAAAANIAPIIRRDLGQSLPCIVASWRVAGDIASEAEIIGRNAVAHPLWAPHDIQIRRAS